MDAAKTRPGKDARPFMEAGLVVGVDEVGRGTWAGPVTACAFAFLDPRDRGVAAVLGDLADSKALTPARRQDVSDRLHALAKSGAVAFGFGDASAREVDEVNVRQATRLAMGRALENLLGPVGVALVGTDILIDGKDGFRFSGLPDPRYLVRGDSKVREIMAASILAKVRRDAWMAGMETAHPGYGFARHKGYGTAVHAAALAALGPCPLHRMTFAPVVAAAKKARLAARAAKAKRK